MIDDFQDENYDEDLEEEILDLEKIKINIPKYSSQKLCELVVCNRYFNMNNEITVMCMEELAIRRQNGDPIHYEKIIEDEFKELPQLSLNLFDIKSILGAFRK